MAQVPSPVSGTPELGFQPWDATDDSTVSGWVSVNPKSGPADSSGNASGDFESGPAPWKQT